MNVLSATQLCEWTSSPLPTLMSQRRSVPLSLLLLLQDLPLLRRLACERGLVSRRLRRRCWPLLLGLDPPPQQFQSPPLPRQSLSPRGGGRAPVAATPAAGFDAALYERWHEAQHRDSQVVVVDVERCGAAMPIAMCQPTRGLAPHTRHAPRLGNPCKHAIPLV